MRSSIQREDPLAQLRAIDQDYQELFKKINAALAPKYDQSVKWKHAIAILDKRSTIAMKLLNKLAPDFQMEEFQSNQEGGNSAIDPSATRDEAIAKLAKALKPKAKVSNITDAK
jgi:hypothetical protein